jgi:hypothetical protein
MGWTHCEQCKAEGKGEKDDLPWEITGGLVESAVIALVGGSWLCLREGRSGKLIKRTFGTGRASPPADPSVADGMDTASS